MILHALVRVLQHKPASVKLASFGCARLHKPYVSPSFPTVLSATHQEHLHPSAACNWLTSSHKREAAVHASLGNCTSALHACDRGTDTG